MEITRSSLNDLPRFAGRWAVTLGTFDGVHRGHQAILAEGRSVARAHGFDGTVAVSFARHPRAMLEPDRRPRILTTVDERTRLLGATGLDRLVVLQFDEHLARLEYDAFVRRVLLQALGMAHFVLGHDVHFGRGRAGTLVTVAELAEVEGFTVSQVASIRHRGRPISSSRIRDCVADGSMREAVRMMGHPYPMTGLVAAGRGMGRELGFPTANLECSGSAKLRPGLGVYAGWARGKATGGWRAAAINVGRAPTVSDEGVVRIEVHLLDSSFDLLGEPLEVGFVSKMRDEFRFEGISSLRAQIGEDVAMARRVLESAEADARADRLDHLELSADRDDP